MPVDPFAENPSLDPTGQGFAPAAPPPPVVQSPAAGPVDPFAENPSLDLADPGFGAAPPIQGSPVARFGRFVGNVARENVVRPIVDAVTGEGRISEDLPEFMTASPQGVSQPQKARIAAAQLFTLDPNAQRDVIEKAIPDARFEVDDFGATIVDLGDGQRFFLNRPGLSPQDLTNFAAQALLFAPAGRLAALATSLRGRVLVGGGSAAVTDAALQDATRQLGGDQDIDATQVAVSAGTGAVGDLVSAPLARIARLFRPGIIDKATGGLNARGRAEFERAGLDPDQVTPEALTQVADVFSRTGQLGDELAESFDRQAEAATTTARAEGRAFGIRRTRGQETGDIEQLRLEERLRRGVQGGRAERVFAGPDGFDRQQELDIQRAGERIRTRLGGGQFENEDQAAGVLVGEIRSVAAATRAAVDEAYEAVRETRPTLTVDNLTSLRRGIAAALRQRSGIDKELTPQTFRVVEQIKRFTDVPRRRRQGITRTTLQALENQRRRISKRIEGATNKADIGALIGIKASFDDWVEDAFDRGLFDGDDGALDLMKFARRQRFELTRKFGTRGVRDVDAGRVIEQILEKKPSNREVMNWALGLADIGSTGTSVRVMRRLLEGNAADGIDPIFPRGSVGHNLLREAAWSRMIWGARPADEAPISPAQIRTRMGRALAPGGGREVMEMLFTPEELREFTAFRRVISSIVPPSGSTGVTNPSGTAIFLSNTVRSTFSRLLPMVAAAAGDVGTAAAVSAAGGARGFAAGQAGASAARSATQSLLPRNRGVPMALGVGGVVPSLGPRLSEPAAQQGSDR